MSITRITNQEVIFVSFQGIGIGLTIKDGKLIPANADETDTSEALLNQFRRLIKTFVRSTTEDLQRVNMMTSMIQLMVKMHGTMDSLENQEKITEALSNVEETVQSMKSRISSAETLLADITDLMMEHGLTISNDLDSSAKSADVISDEEKVKQLLESISKPK